MNFDQLISDVTALTGAKLLMTVLIAIGYGLQRVPAFSNDRIPLVVIVSGMLLAPVLVSWPSPGDMDPGLRFAEITAWVQVIAQGFLLAAASWGIHAGVLKKVIDDRIAKNSVPLGASTPLGT